jgi:hypothetical protein
MPKDHKLSKVGGAYGSPMGRSSYQSTEKDLPYKFYLRRVYLNNGGYDSGGAYWGVDRPLYRAYADPIWFENEKRESDEVEFYVRASDRDWAKKKVTADYPNAKFFN